MLEATANIDPAHPGRITVVSSFRCKDAIKAVPGARWDTTDKVWTVPLTWTACLALRGEFGPGLTIGEELRLWAKEISARKATAASLREMLEPADDYVPPAHPGFSELFPWQHVDAALIATMESFLLLNETGAGKSRSALAGLRLLLSQTSKEAVFPLLIVAPKSMLITWARDEVPNFFPKAEVNVVTGTPTQIKKALTPGADVYVIGWESLRKYSRVAGFGSISLTADEKTDKELQAIGFKSVIFDECHRAKNPTAKRTRAAWAVAADIDHRIGLTGSAIQDTVEDLYGVLHMLFPDEYPNKTAYVDRYLEVDWGYFGEREIKGLHPLRKDEFFKNFDTISRRLTKEVVAPWLPPKIREIRWVTLPPALRKAYNDMEKKLIAELADGSTMKAENNLVRAGRLIQLANAGGEVDADGKFTMKAPSPKIDALLEDIEGGDFDGEQVVVYSDSKQLAHLVAEAFDKKKLKYVAIDGDVTGDARQEAMDRFQAGEVDYCILTRAGGEGITLTAGSTMVRLMRSWSLIPHKQSEDRIHRIGSEKHDRIRYIDYITDDTSEMGQMVRLNAKEGRAQEIMRDDELAALLTSRPTTKEMLGEE